MRLFYTVLFCLITTITFGQLTNGTTISSGSNATIATNGSVLNTGTLALEGALVLDGSGQIQSNSVTSLPSLSIISGDYSLLGTLSISNSLLLGGILSPQTDARLVVESAASISIQGGYVNGSLFHQGTGDKFYPIGTANRYTPVSLSGIQGDENTLVGVQSVNGDIGLSTTVLPVSISAVSSSWYWQITSETTFDGAQVTLPVLAEDEALFSAGNVQGVVIETGNDRSTADNLGRGGGSDNTQVVSRELTVGPAVVIGAENVVEVVIRNLITPNGDNQNDYLFIENLDLIDGTKKVYFLDRWGSRIGEDIDDFVNDDPSLAPFFERFESGNYICILELEDGRTIQQAITILKDQ
ncbi:MAG: gliding motility-associated C-terminal domain-containing protein [Bacteroidota bacterium]